MIWSESNGKETSSCRRGRGRSIIENKMSEAKDDVIKAVDKWQEQR